MLRRIVTVARSAGMPLMSLSIGMLCLMSVFAAGISPAEAQVSKIPGRILSYEDCLLEQKKLRDEAKTTGERAWAKAKALAGAVFTTPEIRALYARASELYDLADKVRCVWKPRSHDASEKSKEIDKAVQALARGALSDYPKQIRELIQAQLKQIQNHNSYLMTRLNDLKEFPVQNSRGLDPEGEAQPPEMVQRQIDEENARARRRERPQGGYSSSNTGGLPPSDPGRPVNRDGDQCYYSYGGTRQYVQCP